MPKKPFASSTTLVAMTNVPTALASIQPAALLSTVSLPIAESGHGTHLSLPGSVPVPFKRRQIARQVLGCVVPRLLHFLLVGTGLFDHRRADIPECPRPVRSGPSPKRRRAASRMCCGAHISPKSGRRFEPANSRWDSWYMACYRVTSRDSKCLPFYTVGVTG